MKSQIYTDFFSYKKIVLKVTANNDSITQICFVKKAAGKKPNTITRQVVSQLKEYFYGSKKKFNVPILLFGTKFQMSVYRSILRIPYGKTVTYGELARKAGFPKASRAVGTACKQNKFPIIIPCHRVVGVLDKYSYSAGQEKKRFLLNMESGNI